MNKYYLLTSIVFLSVYSRLTAQEFYQSHRSEWLSIAAAAEPQLVVTEKRPVSLVSISKDEKSFQGFKVDTKEGIGSFYTSSMKKQSGVILDFGEHLTGYVTFKIEDLTAVADAALRLKFTFAEVPAGAILPSIPIPDH